MRAGRARHVDWCWSASCVRRWRKLRRVLLLTNACVVTSLIQSRDISLLGCTCLCMILYLTHSYNRSSILFYFFIQFRFISFVIHS